MTNNLTKPHDCIKIINNGKTTLSDKFKQAVREEFKNVTGTLRIELSQGGISDAYLNLRIQ